MDQPEFRDEEVSIRISQQPDLVDVTVVILTLNEEIHLERAIRSVRSLASRVVIVDSYSTDRTIEIAKNLGADVYQNKFINYSSQYRWALENISISTRWTMRLDADEIVESDLAENLISRVPHMSDDIVGIEFDCKRIFMGKWVKRGGLYPLRLLRMWRTGQGKIEDRWMDEHVVVWGGKTITMPGGFADANLNDLTFFTDKHNKYATREAIDAIYTRNGWKNDSRDEFLQTTNQAKYKRFIKNNVYYKLPLWLTPVLYIIYRLILKGGIFDGTRGVIYHILQGFWYRFLVNAKVYEFERALQDTASASDKVALLSRLTGHALPLPEIDTGGDGRQ